MNGSAAASGDVWATTVNQLVANFRDCLIALQPVLVRARIWPACYDDWDAIAETLYKNVVIRTIEFALPGEPEDTIRFAAYEHNYDSYKDLSFVEVVHHALPAGLHHVMQGFSRNDGTPFTRVEYVSIDNAGRPIGRGALPADEVRYVFQLGSQAGDLEQIDALSVHL